MGNMRSFRRALRSCAGRPLAYQIRDGYGASMVKILEDTARGLRVPDADIMSMIADMSNSTGALSDDDMAARVALAAGPTIIPGGNGKAVAYIPVKGIALFDIEFQPFCFSTQLLEQNVNSLAANPAIETIILDFATPGGMVTGTAEAADAIWNARKRKNVIGLINPLSASAGYWLASQCTEIWSIKSGDVGSIGVFMAHTDCSAFNEQQGFKVTYIFAGPHKVEGNSDEPLSDDAKAYFQSEVDTIYADFRKAVARGRGVDFDDVEALMGGGRTLMAPAAKKAGMIDDIVTIDVAFQRCGVVASPTTEMRRRGEAAAPEPKVEQTPAAVENNIIDENGTSAALLTTGVIKEVGNEEVGRLFETAISTDTAEQRIRSWLKTEADDGNEWAAQMLRDDRVHILGAAPKPDNVPIMSADGCETISFVTAFGQQPRVVHPWPAKALIPDPSKWIFSSDEGIDVRPDSVFFNAVNGSATYHKDGRTEGGDWVCSLVESTVIEEENASTKQLAVEEPKFDDMEVRRRRMAILRLKTKSSML